MPLSFHRQLLLPAAFVVGMACIAHAQQSVGQLYATDARVKGSVILAGSGTGVLSGSSIEAGAQTATLKLERGGSVQVCQGTRLSVTASQSGRALMFSLNSGDLELNYPLGAAADTLLTPDLRLLLPGPGTVHIAVKISPQGDTCVQSLPWNATAVVVSEALGDATYQVKPDEAVLFKGGHVGDATPTKGNCGCPLSTPTLLAKTAPPPPPPVTPKQPAAKPLAAPPPDEHVVVEAPFVFRASDPIPDLTENVAHLKLENNKLVQLDSVVTPPPANASNADQKAVASQKHGFFSRVGAFVASLFH